MAEERQQHQTMHLVRRRTRKAKEPMPCIWENLLSMLATKPLRENVPPEKVSWEIQNARTPLAR